MEKNNCALTGINNVTHARTRRQTQHTQHTRLHPAKNGRLICVGLPKPTQNIPNTPDTLLEVLILRPPSRGPSCRRSTPKGAPWPARHRRQRPSPALSLMGKGSLRIIGHKESAEAPIIAFSQGIDRVFSTSELMNSENFVWLITCSLLR